jgi:sporulation protein YlmC with PRC-barrel domain
MTKVEATLLSLNDAGLTTQSPDEDIRHREVRAVHGGKIGQVTDLLVDEEKHKVRLLEVRHGGILGIGESKVLVPVDAISSIEDDVVYVDRRREQIAGAPKYDPALVPEADYYDQLYGYYGVAPYWAAGYRYPAYPYFAKRQPPLK